jgi:hypothetical protein
MVLWRPCLQLPAQLDTSGGAAGVLQIGSGSSFTTICRNVWISAVPDKHLSLGLPRGHNPPGRSERAGTAERLGQLPGLGRLGLPMTATPAISATEHKVEEITMETSKRRRAAMSSTPRHDAPDTTDTPRPPKMAIGVWPSTPTSPADPADRLVSAREGGGRTPLLGCQRAPSRGCAAPAPSSPFGWRLAIGTPSDTTGVSLSLSRRMCRSRPGASRCRPR